MFARFLPATILLLAATSARADGVRFPDDAGVVDVTKAPYGAKGDGKADDTKAIQKALDDHPNAGAIIYLPAGAYLITDTLKWPQGSRGGMEHKNTILQGRSRRESIIRLKDKCPGFGDEKKPRALLWTGRKPAQRFRNAVRDLTLDTGRGNAGAVGAQFMANNQGTFREVTIRSGDGGGAIGLDLGYTDENGPCLVKNVHVIGFGVGVRCAFAVDSVTMEHVTVERQAVAGVSNAGQCLSIRGLLSTNAVPAVVNAKGPGLVTLIDSKLTGTGAASKLPAVRNEAALFARNVTVTGYAKAIESKSGGDVGKGPVEEFVSHKVAALFGTPKRSLNLPIQETPTVPWDELKDWASPLQHGYDAKKAGKAKGKKAAPPDASKALQAAIDSGKTTVYLPRGVWRFEQTVILRKNVRRLVGCEARLETGPAMKDKPLFRVEDGAAPVVVLERLRQSYGPRPAVFVENASKRTVVLAHLIAHGECAFRGTGTGDLYLEDVCGGRWEFGKHRTWARQLNVENQGTHVKNAGGTLWVLGFKTERGGTLIETRQGKTEVVGGFVYSTGAEKKEPMFVIDGAEVSVSVRESCFNKKPFEVVVEETRGGVTRKLAKGDVPRWTNGALLALYVSRKE